jgi:hypothetical protein
VAVVEGVVEVEVEAKEETEVESNPLPAPFPLPPLVGAEASMRTTRYLAALKVVMKKSLLP